MYPIFDILTIVVSLYILYSSLKKLHESSVYVYIALIFVFYVTPLLIDYMYIFPEYTKFYGYSISYLNPITRVVYDFCILITLSYLYKKGKKTHQITSMSNIYISHKWTWLGCLIAPLSAIFLVKNPNLLFAFQWRELLLYDPSAKYYLFTEELTYIGICASCLLLFDSKSSFTHPIISKVLTCIFLFFNICIEGKRAALFFTILVIVMILVYKYADEIKQLKLEGRRLSLRSMMLWLVSVSVIFGAVYFMYQFSLDVKINRGYTEETSVMVEAFRIDAFRDDRVRMAIYSKLYPDNMRILNYPGQTIWDCFKYIIPINVISGRLGLSHYMYQHYFTAALQKAPLGPDCFMTVSIFAESISNFGVVFGLMFYLYLTMFFVKMSDRAPHPFNILFIFIFIMMNLFDLSYCMIMIEFCALMYYFNIKRRGIKL